MTMTKSQIFTTAWSNARLAAAANGTTARTEFAAALRAVYGMLRAARFNDGLAAYVAGRIDVAANILVHDFGREGFGDAARAARRTVWGVALQNPVFAAAVDRADTDYTVALLAA